MCIISWFMLILSISVYIFLCNDIAWYHLNIWMVLLNASEEGLRPLYLSIHCSLPSSLGISKVAYRILECNHEQLLLYIVYEQKQYKHFCLTCNICKGFKLILRLRYRRVTVDSLWSSCSYLNIFCCTSLSVNYYCTNEDRTHVFMLRHYFPHSTLVCYNERHQHFSDAMN